MISDDCTYNRSIGYLQVPLGTAYFSAVTALIVRVGKRVDNHAGQRKPWSNYP